MASIVCKNCDNTFEGKFCNNCGQKNYTEKDKSFKHIADEVLHFLTHFESNFIRTVKTVLSKPGKLSLDYCNGKRKIYYKPISFFLLIVVLYLLFPLAKGMNQEMENYESNYFSGRLIHQQIATKMEKTHLSKTALSEKFHHTASKTSKILLLLQIPLSAFILFILFFNHKKYAFDFFILATEFNSFVILCFFILMPVIVMPLFALLRIPDNNLDQILQPVLSVLMLTYTIFLLRRFFDEKWAFTISKSIAFLCMYLFLALPLYRFVIFEITFALI